MSVSAFAEDAVINGIKYSLNNETLQAKVIRNYDNKYSGNITIPETVDYNGKTYSLTSIGSSAFFNCTGLTSVTIGNSVTSIGNNAFSGCSGLTSVTIPNSVTSIGDEAFANCLGLKSITLGNSVMSIGNWAFDNCLELTTVISMIEEPFEINDTFLIPYEGEYDEPEVYIPKTLYVPKGTKKIYKRTKGWNVFHNIVESK